MPRQILPGGRSADPGLLSAIAVGTLGLAFVIAEAAMFSLHGQQRAALALIAILVASAASSSPGLRSRRCAARCCST